MGQTLTDIIASPPADEEGVVESRYPQSKQEIEGLRELRQIAGKAQAEIATVLNIKQPSVSKLEGQVDMHLSTLRSYVEAIGGKLELTVKLPARPLLRLQSLGNLAADRTVGTPTAARRRRPA